MVDEKRVERRAVNLSRFEYVRLYEEADACLPNTYIVVRVDGRGFHKFSDAHAFDKPNDARALGLMDAAARAVMAEFADAVLAFGESDEYSFLFRRSTALYSRRRSKINSAVCSVFTANYVLLWPTFFPARPLAYAPTFDSRVVLYPSERDVRDYFGWRQADTHINNLYNTAFWALVQSGSSTKDAHKALQGTESRDKNELLFSRFGTNYNALDPMFRKGSTCVRVPVAEAGPSNAMAPSVPRDADAGADKMAALAIAAPAATDGAAGSASPGGEVGTSRKAKDKERKRRPYDGTSGPVEVLHVDIIRDTFWAERPWLLV
ncbi:tRNA-His guanylyltransferase [Cryptotrichosporon argae]